MASCLGGWLNIANRAVKRRILKSESALRLPAMRKHSVVGRIAFQNPPLYGPVGRTRSLKACPALLVPERFDGVQARSAKGRKHARY